MWSFVEVGAAIGSIKYLPPCGIAIKDRMGLSLLSCLLDIQVDSDILLTSKALFMGVMLFINRSRLNLYTKLSMKGLWGDFTVVPMTFWQRCTFACAVLVACSPWVPLCLTKYLLFLHCLFNWPLRYTTWHWVSWRPLTGLSFIVLTKTSVHQNHVNFTPHNKAKVKDIVVPWEWNNR